MADGCLLCFPNRIDEGTLSGGSWLAGLPLTNIQNRLLGKVARSTNDSLSSTKFIQNVPQARRIEVVAIVNHNLSFTGKWRLTVSTTDATMATYDYDSGWLDAWPAVYASSDLEWEDDNYWAGTYSSDEIENYTSYSTHILTTPIIARYWKIEFDDVDNPDTYVELGRVFIGPAWQPSNDAEIGLTMGWETNTQMQKALNGTKYYQRRIPYRVTNFTIQCLEDDEAMANAFEIDRLAGIDQEIMYIFSATDTVHSLRRRYLATLRQLSPVEFPWPNLRKKGYSLEEIL